MTACSNSGTGGNNMSSEKEARLREFYDQVMNAHNPAMIDSFCTAEFVDHQADPHYPAGIAGLKAAFNDFFAAFPDVHVTTNSIKAWGDTVMSHITMTGTNSGSWMGMPPTGKQFNIEGMDLIILKDRKASERWGYSEEMKMMTQLGMMGGAPPADSSKR